MNSQLCKLWTMVWVTACCPLLILRWSRDQWQRLARPHALLGIMASAIITFWSKWPNSCRTGHLIIWVPTARAAWDPGAYQYPHEHFGMQRHRWKWFFKRYFSQKKPSYKKSKIYTHPVIKFTVSEFDLYLFFSSLTYYT